MSIPQVASGSLFKVTLPMVTLEDSWFGLDEANIHLHGTTMRYYPLRFARLELTAISPLVVNISWFHKGKNADLIDVKVSGRVYLMIFPAELDSSVEFNFEYGHTREICVDWPSATDPQHILGNEGDAWYKSIPFQSDQKWTHFEFGTAFLETINAVRFLLQNHPS